MTLDLDRLSKLAEAAKIALEKGDDYDMDARLTWARYRNETRPATVQELIRLARIGQQSEKQCSQCGLIGQHKMSCSAPFSEESK